MNNIVKILTLVVVTVILGFGAFSFINTYNTLVAKQEKVNVAYSQIQSNIQRELDLIPNLIKVVQKHASYEQTTIQNITKLRSQASQVLNDKTASNKKIKELQNFQNKLNETVIKLYSVVENYPELQASESFLELQSQIEGAQNRINIARMMFNEAVGDYNSYLKSIPANLVGKIASFKPKTYFKAEKQPEKIFKWETK